MMFAVKLFWFLLRVKLTINTAVNTPQSLKNQNTNDLNNIMIDCAHCCYHDCVVVVVILLVNVVTESEH